MAPSSSRVAEQHGLGSILSRIRGVNKTARSSALDELHYLLNKKTKSSSLSVLEDKEYHSIFEALFRCSISEKQDCLGGSKSAAATAKTRLGKCSQTLRAAVEQGLGKLRRKTTLAAVDHITETLPGPDGEFFEPMANDYVKTLLLLLSRPANVEQLAKGSGEGWSSCIEFCADAISRYLDRPDQDSSLVGRSSPAPGSAQSLSLTRSTPRSSSNPLKRDSSSPMSQTRLAELLECINHLVSVPHAPLRGNARQIVQPILRVLHIRHMTIGHVHQHAFSIVNTVLSGMEADDIAFARNCARELVSLVSYWWQAQKVAKDEMLKSVRDEIMKTVFTMCLQLEAIAQETADETASDKFRTGIEELLDTFWTEYSRRDASARLQVDHLNFGSASVPADYFQTPIFSLQPYNREGERQWAVLQCIAILEAILAKIKAFDRPISAGGEQPRKRRRTAQQHNRIRRKLKSMDAGIQFTALQLVPFLAHTGALDDDETWEIVADLAKMLSDKRPVIASWAMLGCAGCTLRRGASDEALGAMWKQIWQVAVRTVSMPGTSRSTCVLLHAMLETELASYPLITEDVNNMVTTADINGPAVLVDSSLRLMLHLLRIRNSKLPSASQSTCNHMLRWVFLKWHAADLTSASLYSRHLSQIDLVNLLRVCCGIGLHSYSGCTQLPGGPLVQSWKHHHERSTVVRYLLLLKEAKPVDQIPSSCGDKGLGGTRDSEQNVDSSSFLTSKKLLLELLYPKLEEMQELCDSWGRKGLEGGQQISEERLQSLFSLCLCTATLLPYLTELNSVQSRDIEPCVYKVVDGAIAASLESMESQALLEAILRTSHSSIPEITAPNVSRLVSESPHLGSVLARLARAMNDYYNSKPASAQNTDIMDIDDDFESQNTKSSAASRVVDVPRSMASLVLDASAFYLDTCMRLYLLESLSTESGQAGLVPSEFLDTLMALSDEEFLLCRASVLEVIRSDMMIEPDNAFRIVEKTGGIVGRVPDYDCCETAIATCLDIIRSLLPVWIDDTDDLGDMVGDLYHHFVKLELPSNSLSPRIQISLAELLLAIMVVKADYADALRLSSCRTTLLSIDSEGCMAVKFFVGSHIADIFGLYILTLHDNIVVDVLSNLPTDPECIEGIAYRIYVLAELAQRWPTLLRRCVYHIFETPGSLPESAKYATRCLSNVASTLKLNSPTELFKLFAPQILFTWMPEHGTDSIPYMIFGFDSLDHLLRVAQVETTAQMVSREQEESIDDLAKRLGVSEQDLVISNFPKTMAYAIAYDLIRQRKKKRPEQQDSSGSGSNGIKRTVDSTRSSVMWLKRLLGSNKFMEACYNNFADIVAHIMNLFDQEDNVDKYLKAQLPPAAEIMAEMKKYSFSDLGLPLNQQPAFKASHLLLQLNELCKVAVKYELSSIWTPAMVVFVARRLINTVHPALGSLHACSVLRKLRVLICLAGSAATTSYPVEMLLHSIREFIVDSVCADDAMGISQYLITKGKPHLERAPSFLAGYALSTLASLRVFLESSQSSTTQESQFKATMSKAKKFHSWLTKFLTDYASPAFSDSQLEKSFRSVTQSAAHIRSSGNADKGTHESSLLLEILRDQDQPNPLLNESARDLALGLLCGDFKLSESSQADIIATDEEAVRHGPVVWKSCKAQALSDQYLAWAGRVTGRSFAASGRIPDELLQESRVHEYQRITTGRQGSHLGLLHLLQDLTMHKDARTAGLAEAALRSIVSDAKVSEDEAIASACLETLSEGLYEASDWGEYFCPPSENPTAPPSLDETVFALDVIGAYDWVQRLAVYLTHSMAATENVLTVLGPVLAGVKGFADRAFPFLLHLVLLTQQDHNNAIKKKVSEAFKEWLAVTTPSATENQKLILNTILYLRTQAYPSETSIADRSHWLDVDAASAARAAARCGMHKTSLLFVEGVSHETTTARSSRRSAAARDVDMGDLLLTIFENMDDPDAYYGLEQPAGLSTVLARLEHEKDGAKSLAFRGAQYDSHIRRRDGASESDDSQALVKALGTLGLSGLSHSLLQGQQSLEGSGTSLESTFQTARRLEIWNLPAPASTLNHAVTTYKAFQGVHQAAELSAVRKTVLDGFGETMRALVGQRFSAASLRLHLGSLAVLTELDDVLNVGDFADMEQTLAKLDLRNSWMRSGRYEDVSQILSCRETALSLFSQKALLRGRANIAEPQAREIEIRSMLMDSGVYRFHEAIQECLNLSTTLTDMIGPCEALGLNVDAAIRLEAANSLWDHGEMTSSIGLLRSIDSQSNLKKQTIPVSLSDLLAKIGHQVSLARLEKPDDIQKKYLEPALKELKGQNDGKGAGQVFHQFAMFCDEQLQNPDSLEDLARLKSLKKGKSDEVAQLNTLIKASKDPQMARRYNQHLTRAKLWLSLDEKELKRVEVSRKEFVRLSLENYLLCLAASETHNGDALRFTAMWLERSDEEDTNDAVAKHLSKVPTRKFVNLMNQLTSRLQDEDTQFQNLLYELITNICVDHPYHGLYQIWAGINSKVVKQDDVAKSRSSATKRVAVQLSQHKGVHKTWMAIDKTSHSYNHLAQDKSDKFKLGAKVSIKSINSAHHLLSRLVRYPIPPPTMQLEPAADRDYSRVPRITGLDPYMVVASGVSAPKIVTAVASDGKRYKQLVKGGNDDLRQDAIMEQVFAAVSSLLKLHRATQQRNLGIRTYKVLPLTSSSGIIEFVQDTVPLHEFLIPAHERYHPRDYRGSHCRKEIGNAQGKSQEQRLQTYRRVTERFRPAMRYFFLERFPDPDDWFAARLAYTRSTAAVSMLGHVLGLGDRHGHNILLDAGTGETVHIDLGVAFEMGRVLPVPEVVPFRLTRDVVDGMGVTGAEGVFRRCCEFTLGALREETYSIMTILDVLRYDPLYSWSMSPVRLAKLQDNSAKQEETASAAAAAAAAATAATPSTEGTTTTGEDATGSEMPPPPQPQQQSKRKVNEPSEADRALEVVRKKLSKTLSVTAMVNDLIVQATDERNLAVLYSGWAAYA